jgi:hypothetical protein
MGDYIAIYAELADKIIVKPFAYADAFKYKHFAISDNPKSAEAMLREKLTAISAEYSRMAEKFRSAANLKVSEG